MQSTQQLENDKYGSVADENVAEQENNDNPEPTLSIQAIVAYYFGAGLGFFAGSVLPGSVVVGIAAMGMALVPVAYNKLEGFGHPTSAGLTGLVFGSMTGYTYQGIVDERTTGKGNECWDNNVPSFP